MTSGLPRSVALVTTARQPGGVWRHIEDLGRGLSERGIDVVVVVPAAAPALQASATAAGLAWSTARRALLRGVDVWHAHLHDTYDRTAFAMLLARRASGPTVITEHLPRSHASDLSLEPQFPRTRGAAAAKTAMKRTQFAAVSELIAVSNGSSRFLQTRYRLDSKAVRIVHNGVVADTDAAPAEPGPRLRVVAIGSLIRQKGLDVLVEAAARSAGGWDVTIVGDGPQLARLRADASNLGAGRICFEGWVDDPIAEIRAADVVCMPSRWESFPYTALEAAAQARCVVGTRVDGLDEIILPKATGALVAPESPDELAAALDGLAAQPALAKRWGRSAHEHVMRHFGLERMVDGTVEVYARAMRRSR